MVPSQFRPHFIFGYCAVVPRKLVFLVVLVKQVSDILWNVCNGGYWCLFEIICTVVFIPKFKTPPLHTNFATHCFSLLLSFFFFCSLANLTPMLLENFFLHSLFCQAQSKFHPHCCAGRAISSHLVAGSPTLDTPPMPDSPLWQARVKLSAGAASPPLPSLCSVRMHCFSTMFSSLL